MNHKLYVRIAAIMLMAATACQQAATPAAQVPTAAPAVAAATKAPATATTVPATAVPTAATTATVAPKEGTAIPCATECEWVINDAQGKIDPTGMAIDQQGNLVVLDNSKARYLTFDASGKLLLAGKFETPKAKLNTPTAVAIDSQGNIYVADAHLNMKSGVKNAVVTKFDAQGKFIQMLAAKETVLLGGVVLGLEVDAEDNVYAADFAGDMVYKFDSSGTYIAAIGSPGNGDGQFKTPLGLAVDSSGALYVADLNNYRINKFDSTGKYVGKITSCGTDTSIKFIPIGIAFDAAGNMYVTDNGSVGVCKYDATGTFVSRWGSVGTGDGQFGEGEPFTDLGIPSPHGIAIDKQGNIYVGDEINQRIVKFAPR